MPGRDRRGPMGAGPATGRGMGYCTGRGMGAGFGRGRGMGRGFGPGFGFGAAAPVFYPPSEQEQEAYLAARETALEEELGRIRQARQEGRTETE